MKIGESTVEPEEFLKDGQVCVPANQVVWVDQLYVSFN